jgi:hypothetical protein
MLLWYLWQKPINVVPEEFARKPAGAGIVRVGKAKGSSGAIGQAINSIRYPGEFFS